MTEYFRPLVQHDHPPGVTMKSLAGRSLWFSHVERLDRDGASDILPVDAVPLDLLTRLTAARPHFSGPSLMGVLNVTPDSFSDGGRHSGVQAALAHTRQMIEEGAAIIDIGGESTRPGAAYVEPSEEIARTVPVIKAIRAAGISAPISIDTRKAEVARAACAAGADMINDVSALSFDPAMAGVVAELEVPLCLMHAQGDPKTMQQDPRYDYVLLDVYDYLEERVAYAVGQGIGRDKLLIDPGIGFGKTQAHNLALLRNLSLFHGIGCPILLGVSRKGFIGQIGGQAEAALRGPGSLAVALFALEQGVQIIRAHDIDAHRQGFALWRALSAVERTEQA